jgi:hypothetical protein
LRIVGQIATENDANPRKFNNKHRHLKFNRSSSKCPFPKFHRINLFGPDPHFYQGSSGTQIFNNAHRPSTKPINISSSKVGSSVRIKGNVILIGIDPALANDINTIDELL